MPSPSLLLLHHHHRLSPRFAPSRSRSPRTLSLPPAPRLRLRASARGGGVATRDHDDGARSIPIARCYEAALARLDLSGAARREQAVAAAAAADGGAAAEVPADFSTRSSDEKLLAALAEAIFSCVIEDARNNYLWGTGGLFHKWKSNCSLDSSVCIHRISQSEVVNSARRHLDSFDLVQSSHVVGKAKNGWWPAPKSERLAKIGGPDFMLWASEFVYTYKLRIDAKAFKNTKLGGHHELANNKGEVLLSHSQMVELANILDMYFEDQFTLPGKTFYSNWNSEPSKIKKNNGYLNNLFALLAGSSIVFLVGAIAQLCWPQSLKDKRLATVSSCVSSSQSNCSDIHSLDSSEL